MADLSDVIFTVLRPGKVDRLFTGTRAAVEFLIDHPGEAHLYGPNGLIMSKGVIGARGGMPEDKKRRPGGGLSIPPGPGSGSFCP